MGVQKPTASARQRSRISLSPRTERRRVMLSGHYPEVDRASGNAPSIDEGKGTSPPRRGIGPVNEIDVAIDQEIRSHVPRSRKKARVKQARHNGTVGSGTRKAG